MKKTRIKRIISVLLSLLMVITALPVIPMTAAAVDDTWDEALDEYEYFFSVKTTDDADGWNWAYMDVYLFDDNTYTNSQATRYWIEHDIDDSGEEFRAVLRSTQFLDKVVVHVDFGGGWTWHDWAGDLTVKINGTNVISTSMSCDSTPGSSSDRAFSNRITSDKYPKVDEDNSRIFVQSADSSTLSSDLTFRQGESEEKGITQGYLYAQLVDQYGVVWHSLEDIEIKSKTHPDYDIFEFSEIRDNKAVFNVTSTYNGAVNDKYHSNDHLSKLTLSYPWYDPAKTYIDGSDSQVATIPLEINFKYLHDVKINLNKELFAESKEYEGTQIPIDFGIPAGYRIKSFTKTGAGELVNNNDNTAVLTVGNGDVTVTGNKVANTYYIDYDKNAADATGEMTSTLATYDKASVSIKNSTFNREGYSFLGWNTKPDGTGTAFAGGAAAKKPNLTTENGAHVTLYAQWGKNVLTVVLNYPAETGLLPRTVNVNRLLSIEPEEFIDVDSSSGHYRYTGADRSLEKITEDMSVNLYYEKVEHNFGEPFVSVEPTCTTDGVETQMCEDCGYEKHTVIPAYHQDLRTDAGYAATCTEDGAETVIKCYACGEIVKNGEVIPAYGHDYNYKRASWSFSTASGELKGWATVTCKNDKTHQWTEEAVITKNDKGFLCTAYFDDYEVSTTLRLGKDIYSVNVTSTDGGTVTAAPSVAFKGDIVYLSVERETNSYLTGLTATSGSKNIEIEDNSFVMPKGNVEVTAEFSNVASNQCGDNAYWYYDEDTRTLTIAGTGAMYDYDEVTAPWFKHSEAKYLAQLNIEDGITYIGKEAFSGFGRIVYDVYMADSVTEIGERAFYRSDAVGKVRFSQGLETIGDYAFAGCEQMFQRFVLPATLTSIGEGVFESDSTIQTVFCYANPANLTWTDATYDFKQNKGTYIYVNSDYLEAYQEKFGDSVRATFVGGAEKSARNVTIGESEHGTVSADCTSAPYLTIVRLTAEPDEGYDFSNYVVTDSYGESVTVKNNEFSMPTTAVTVIGIFKPLYNVATETPDKHGTVTVSKYEAMEGETVEITTSPYLGYRVDTLTVTDSNDTELELNGNSFTMPATDVTVSATFAEYTHKVNCTVDGPGTVTGNLYADAGDTVSLTVTPDTGAELKSLYLIDEYGNSVELDANNSFTMPDCDVNLFAVFEAQQYTITYQATNGTVTGQETAAYGEEVKITATPDEGYVLKDVYVRDWNDISFDKSSSTFIMPARNITVTAAFETAPFTISYYSMTNGTVSCADLTPEPGTTVNVTPNPDKGYYLSNLYYHRVSASNTKTYNKIYDNKFVMPYGDVIVGANFSKLSYPIIDKSKNGSIEANLTAEYDSEVICNLVPNDGYVLDSVSVKDLAGNDVACTVYGNSQRCKFTMPASAAIVSATFVKDETEYSITYTSGENGSVSGTESSLPGKAVLINIAADEGYTLKSFSVKADGNDISYNADLSFTMPNADVTVTAEYVATAKCGENINWKYDVFTKTLTVYGTGAMYDYDGTNMPWYGMDINRVVVDMGISYVGAYAFYESDAETVYIADSVEEIGSYAFYGSHSLKAVHMPERLTEIGTYAFAYCDALEQLDFPSLLVYVRDSAFTGTTAMDKIWCDMTTADQLQWGSAPHALDEFKPSKATTIFVAGSLRNDAQWNYVNVINAKIYYTTDEANTKKHGITVTTDSFGTVKPDFDNAPAGRLVYLTVTPLENYELTSLTVTDENGEEIEVTNNTFIMPGTAVTVNATFARKIYDVVTQKTVNGTISCADSAAWGTSVPITVTPDEGYALKSLTVTDASGNDVTVTNNAFTMPTAGVTVSAEFEKQSYGITYRPAVHGSISGPENAELGDSVAITVIPEQYYKLASLTVKTNGGEDVSVEGTKFIMPDEAVVVIAAFEKIDYDIVYKVSGNGMVTGAKTANYGDEVSLTVTSDTGAALESLAVTDVNGDEVELTENAFTMPEGTVTVTAKFTSADYSITYNETEHGSITGYAAANYGSSVTVNATPDEGYVLDTLTVTDSEENETVVTGDSFTMPDSDVSVNATFKKISSKVIYIKTVNGTVSGPETAEYGDTVSVSPIASIGNEFTSLSVKTLSGEEIETTGNTFTMPDEPVVVKAQFNIVDYPVTYNVSQGGTVTGAETANYNDSIELTVAAETGYELETLTVTDAEDNELTVENDTFTMPDCAVTVNAVFKKTDYTVTYTETQKGMVTGVETANYGDEVTLTVTPDTGCELEALTVTDADENEVIVTNGKFTMPACNVTVSATFCDTDYTVAYGETENGTVTGATVANYGDEITLTVTPDTGYELQSLTVKDGDENDITVTENTFTMPAGNVTVSAVFKKTDYAITYVNSEGGTVSGAQSANYGDEVTFSVTPNTNYVIESVIVKDSEENEISIDESYTFTMPASAVSVAATFRSTVHTITYGETENGTVTGPANAAWGSEVTLNVVPDESCKIRTITVTDENNNSISIDDSYTFTMPDSNVTVSAEFNALEAYAKYDDSTKTFYFCCDADKPLSYAWSVDDTGNTPPWASVIYNADRIVIEPSFASARPKSTAGWFYDSWVDEIEGLEYLNTSETTSMTYMFRNAKIKSVDISTFDTSSLEKIGYMFDECTLLETVTLGNFDVSNLTSANGVFFGCTALERIYVYDENTNWLTENPNLSSTNVFYNCRSLVGGTGTAFNSSAAGMDMAKVQDGYFTYEAEKFTVKWVVGGTVVETDENVSDGTKPEFNGETPADYTADNTHYTFYGWNDGTTTYAPSNLPAVTSNVTYTAVYTAAGHSYGEPEWTWAEDYSTATAAFTCSVGGETETVDATVTAENAREKITYTATAEFNENTYNDTKVVNKQTFSITVASAQNGEVTANFNEAYEGDEVTLTVTPNDGYLLDTLTVTDADENYITVTNGKFTMPASNVTVTATFVAALVTVSDGANTAYYATLDEALASWTQGTTLTLLADISMSSRITSTGTKTLDLNGCTLTRTGGTGTEGQVIFVSSGTLTVNDSSGDNSGVITGGNANNGGGINIGANGSLTLNGGTITGNTAGTRAGGVSCRGTFNMNGGVITNNTSANGGGVAVWEGGTFNLNGGVITNNTSSNGGGIDLINGTLNIQGNPQIVANKKSDNTQSNILLSENQTVSISGELTEGASIGVSTAAAPTLAAPVVIQNAGEAASLGYFSSDNDAYHIGLDDSGNVVLRVNMTFTAVSAAAASCVDNGYTQNCWLGEDGNYYADENGVTQISTASVVIPATGVHTYGEPEWAWVQDYSSVAATFTCTVGGETETVNATVTSENSRDKITYTATAEFEGNTYTDIRVVNKTLSTVTVVPSENGTVTASLDEAYEGEEVTLTAIPGTGFSLGMLTVKDADENDITVTDGKFTMPASDVTISATFNVINYNLYVGGVHVNGANCNDVLGDGKVSFNVQTNELTLNGATVEVDKRADNATPTQAFGIRYNQDEPFTIKLVGENRIVDASTDEEGVTEKYGIFVASSQSFTVNGNGSLSIEMNADDENTYYGIQSRQNTNIDGAGVSINIPGTAPTYGYYLMYSNQLTLENGASLKAVTGSNENTYSFYNDRNNDNLIAEEGTMIEAVSGNAAFNSQFSITSATKTLGVKVSATGNKADSNKWNGSTSLGEYKYIMLPFSEPENAYNLNLENGIKVNFFIDMPYYDAVGGHIEYSYLETTEDKNASRKTYSVNDSALDIQDDGTRKLILKAAPAQLAEEYSIYIYNAAGEKINEEPITASIEDYCNAILGAEAYSDYHALIQSLLNYGALADEYFGYAAFSKAETGNDYSISHSLDYKADVDAESFRSKAKASVSVGKDASGADLYITGVSYLALLEPEFRFYVSQTNEVWCYYTELSISDPTLTAKWIKTENGNCVSVTGLKADDFGKIFTLTIGTTEITYNGYAYLYTVLRSESTADENLKNLAKGVFRYAAACEAKFI